MFPHRFGRRFPHSFVPALAFLVAAATFGPPAHAQPQPLTWNGNTSVNFDGWSGNIAGVAFGQGRFVVAAWDGGIANRAGIAYSTDLVNWTPATLPAGIPPTQFGQEFFPRSAAYGNGMFIVGAFGQPVANTQKILTSSDGGVTWTRRDVKLGDVWGLAYLNGTWFAVGNTGNNTSNLATSPDGITWTLRATGSADDLYGVAYGNNIYVAVGAGSQAVTSTDGVTWTRRTVPDAGANLRDIVFANGRFVACAYGGIIYTSTDGLAWTKIDTGTGSNARLESIAYGGGRFVAAGNNTSVSSADGLTWITDSTNLRLVMDLAYGNGVFALGASFGTVYRSGTPTVAGPVITAQPQSRSAVAGGSVTFAVAASGSGNTYQWRKDGVNIAGATAATLTLTNLTDANVGSYSVVIANSDGTVTSNIATLTLVNASAAGRLINLSVLTSIASAGDSFTLGYVVGGDGTSGAKSLVVRAAGPSLGALGVPGTLDDPKMELFAGSTKTGENDNWGGSTELTAALASVGAFAYTGPTSRDSAATASITTRDNSVKVTAANGTSTGAVIAEVYDATPGGSFTAATPRLLNVSVIKNIGTKLTAGFVIGGQTAKTVLIRAVGPGLSAVGVTSGTAADPQLVLFGANATRLGENNDWGGTAQLSAAFTAVGAFNIPGGSRDAALVSMLAPGTYTVEVSPATGATGLALIEIYEVP